MHCGTQCRTPVELHHIMSFFFQNDSETKTTKLPVAKNVPTFEYTHCNKRKAETYDQVNNKYN